MLQMNATYYMNKAIIEHVGERKERLIKAKEKENNKPNLL
jgi:hypothetical protein